MEKTICSFLQPEVDASIVMYVTVLLTHVESEHEPTLTTDGNHDNNNNSGPC